MATSGQEWANVKTAEYTKKLGDFMEARTLHVEGKLDSKALIDAWMNYEAAYVDICVSRLGSGSYKQSPDGEPETIDMVRMHWIYHVMLREDLKDEKLPWAKDQGPHEIAADKEVLEDSMDTMKLIDGSVDYIKSSMNYLFGSEDIKLLKSQSRSIHEHVMNIESALRAADCNLGSSHMDLRAQVECLMKSDMLLDNAETMVAQIAISHPWLSFEIMKIKVEISEIVDVEWKACPEQVSEYLKKPGNYQAFKASNQYNADNAERHLVQLKRLMPLPEVELVRSHEELWKVLDFIYDPATATSVTGSGFLKRNVIKRLQRRATDETTMMITILKPSVDPPFSTSAVQLFRLKSFREQRSSIPCLRSCKAGDCDHNVLVFDGMIVELDATPMGLGIEEYGVIGLIPRYDIKDVEEMDEIVESFGGLGLIQTIINRTRRDPKDGTLSIGLNVVVGEQEGGLPLLKNQELKHREELANLKTALLPALEMTMEGSQGLGDIPDFGPVRKNLEAGVYTRARQGLKDVENILDRYVRLAMIASKTKGTEKEGKARLQLHKGLVHTMEEFHMAINSSNVTYIDAKQELAAMRDPPESKSGPLIYLGPARNATPNNFLASLPIVQFKGVGEDSSMEQLIDAWCHYTREQSKEMERPEYVMYNNKRCDLKVRIKDLDMVLDALYFSLPVTYNDILEDDRDIEQLLDFIEGDEGNEKKSKGEKKKKKRKKRSGIEQSTDRENSTIQPEILDKKVYVLLIRGLTSPGHKFIQQEIKFHYEAHGAVEGSRRIDPKSHGWCFLAKVTFERKDALHRSAEVLKSTKTHLLAYHRLVVEEALRPFLDAWEEVQGEIPKSRQEVTPFPYYLTDGEHKQLYSSLDEWGRATSDLLIRNIPSNCSTQDLSDMFSTFGKVEYVRIIKHQGWPEVAILSFASNKAILSALKAGRSTTLVLKGQRLLVEDGCKTDIAFANFMTECLHAVGESKKYYEERKAVESLKKSIDVPKSPKAERGKTETKVDQSKREGDLEERRQKLKEKELSKEREQKREKDDRRINKESQRAILEAANEKRGGVEEVAAKDRIRKSQDEKEGGALKAEKQKEEKERLAVESKQERSQSKLEEEQEDQKTQREKSTLVVIEEKEARLKENKEYLEYVRQVKGKKMAHLITTLDALEDEKNKKTKEISVVDMKIADLQADRERLIKEVEERNDQMISLAREKEDLEKDIDRNVEEAKRDIAALEEEIKSLRIDSPSKAVKSKEEPKPKRNPNMQLLEYIENKIEAKQKELECPVCLEIASAPIFTCSDLHLICSHCYAGLKVAAAPCAFDF